MANIVNRKYFLNFALEWKLDLTIEKFIEEDLSYVVENCNFSDWFILMQLSNYLDSNVFHEFIIDLRKELTVKNRPSLITVLK